MPAPGRVRSDTELARQRTFIDMVLLPRATAMAGDLPTDSTR